MRRESKEQKNWKTYEPRGTDCCSEKASEESANDQKYKRKDLHQRSVAE